MKMSRASGGSNFQLQGVLLHFGGLGEWVMFHQPRHHFLVVDSRGADVNDVFAPDSRGNRRLSPPTKVSQ